MLNQQTINKLYELKLTGMAEAFADQLNQPDMDRLSFAERSEKRPDETQCLRRGY
jgi:hypothetical protein